MQSGVAPHLFSDLFGHVFADRSSMMLSLLVFLAVATLAFSLMVLAQARGALMRRTSTLAARIDGSQSASAHSLRGSSPGVTQRLIAYTTKHYSTVDDDKVKVLRRRLILAGIYNPRAVGYFFLIRAALAGILILVGSFAQPLVLDLHATAYWAVICTCGLVGYVGPSLYLDRRTKKLRQEHQAGFPDFMDLLVVCADSGLSMEAALDRVGRELGDSYPSLCSNIHIANLEIRAGRTMSEALEHLGDRLGLEEARSFSTLIQQSVELGSSITDALRVYSDDMRHQRLSRAEEKAHALPVKLSLPMMICIFPVIFVVILLPVFVRLHYSAF
jgi:tight adherence protein C